MRCVIVLALMALGGGVSCGAPEEQSTEISAAEVREQTAEAAAAAEEYARDRMADAEQHARASLAALFRPASNRGSSRPDWPGR